VAQTQHKGDPVMRYRYFTKYKSPRKWHQRLNIVRWWRESNEDTQFASLTITGILMVCLVAVVLRLIFS
jgi:hypothetical protein